MNKKYYDNVAFFGSQERMKRECDRYRAQYKQHEKDNDLIEKINNKPTVMKKCSQDKTLEQNKETLDILKRGKYGRENMATCYQETDKVHQNLINQYKRKVVKCNKIIKKQKKENK